jgi:uncharacterized protein
MSESKQILAPLPFPSLGQTIALLIVTLLISIGLSMPAVVLTILQMERVANFLVFPAQVGTYGITLWIAKVWSKRSWGELLALRCVHSHVWAPLLISIAGLIILTIGVDAILNHFLPTPEWLNKMIMSSGFLVAVVGAPLAEESLFRGVILGGFLGRYGRWKSILLSALLFALFHLNPWQLISPLIIGIFAGWVFSEIRSIWPAVFAHFANNVFFYIAHRRQESFLTNHHYLLPLPLWGIGLLLLALGILWLNKVVLLTPEENCNKYPLG